MATVELRTKLDTGGRGKYLPSNSITFRVDGILLVVFHATETMISLGLGTPSPPPPPPAQTNPFSLFTLEKPKIN